MPMVTKISAFLISAAISLTSCSLFESNNKAREISKGELEGCFHNLNADINQCGLWCFDLIGNRYVYYKNNSAVEEELQTYEIKAGGKIVATGFSVLDRAPNIENPSTETFNAYRDGDTLFARFEGQNGNYARFVLTENMDVCGKAFQLIAKPDNWSLK